MNLVQNHKKYLNLRQKYQTFEYHSYSYNVKNGSLVAEYLFKLGNDIIFRPVISFEKREFYRFDNLSDLLIENMVFHVGMVELISYWKAACPAKVIVRPHKLTGRQVAFWKKLYFNGLGEFFYLNGITASQDDFMKIESQGEAITVESVQVNSNQVMVPVGGGKDSVVTLELLKSTGQKVVPMALNPREAVVRTIENAGFSMADTVVVKRTLDKKLLELNSSGFLNGHTPFSALLAFVTSFAAVAAGIKYIALSNESSANESTVPGSGINHQYSKSFEFEKDFADYFRRFVAADVYYFSFLRPLNELQIGALFSKFTQHHYSFRSCNVGSKTDSWCGHCPKCLFTRIILGPFLGDEKLNRIFGDELLDNEKLKVIFDELAGLAKVKPFECVGTPNEVNAALSYIAGHQKHALPLLLAEFSAEKNADESFLLLLRAFNNEHRLPDNYLAVLKDSLRSIEFAENKNGA